MSLGKLDIWSTPKLAPLYPEFPIQYRNVQILTSVYETSAEAIARHLDAPLKSLNNYVMIHNYLCLKCKAWESLKKQTLWSEFQSQI